MGQTLQTRYRMYESDAEQDFLGLTQFHVQLIEIYRLSD